MKNLFVNLLTTSFSYGEERHFVRMTLSKIYAEAVYNDFCDKVDLADYCESLTQYNNCMFVYFVGDAEGKGAIEQLYKNIEAIIADANKNSVTHDDLKNKLRNLRKGVIVKN